MQNVRNAVTTIWHVRLFDGPILSDAYGMETRRFRSHKVGALLAYLALHLDRSCPREELYEALWPDEDPQVVANRFRVTLNSLRRHLEPTGTLFGSVLDVRQPGHVRLRSESVTCDTIECERLLKSGHKLQATQLMVGTLLPGFYEEWAVLEQARYALLAEDLSILSHPSSPAQPTEFLAWSAEELPAFASETTFPALHHPSLPLYLTGFCGRETEARALIDLIHQHRLVSLVGMGGIGKTRLAVEVAKELGRACLFLSLVSLPDPERLYDVVLQSLGIVPNTETSVETQAIRVLNRRGPLLMILDNVEHLLDAVAAMALRMLAQVPGLRLLITSRQRLSVSGEAILMLNPLETPGPTASSERLLEFASFALFVDRARNARPDLRFRSAIRSDSGDLSTFGGDSTGVRTGGSAHHLADTPADRTLSGDRADPPESAPAWSLPKASVAARRPRRQPCAAHRGAATIFFGSLRLSRQLVRGGRRRSDGVPGCRRVSAHLTVCSLITIQEDERLGVMRYALLETLRQFASESLDTAAEAHYRERHARFYIAMVMQANLEDFRFMDRLEADHENLLVAMEWFWQFDQAALRPLLASLLNLWANRGYHRLALSWIAQRLPGEDLIRAAQETGTLIGLRTYVDVGRYEEAERVARAVLDAAASPINHFGALHGLGYVLMMQEQWDPAITCLRAALYQAAQNEEEQSRSMFRLCSNHLAQALNGRALYAGQSPASQMEDYREAERHLERMHTLLADNNRLQAPHYGTLMRSLWGQQRVEEGDRCFARALQIAVTHRHLTALIYTIHDGAFRLAAKGSAAEAVQLLACAEALKERTGYRSAPYIEAHVQKDLKALRSSLGNEIFDRNWQRGFYTPLEVLIPSILPLILL